MKFMLGRLTIDGAALVISLDGQPLPAPPKVVELIAILGEREGEVFSKEALIERLWPQGYADDATLWQTIYLARKLLAKTGQAKIETLPRRGYRISVIPSVAGEPRIGVIPSVAAEPRIGVIPSVAAEPRSRGSVSRAVAAAAVLALMSGVVALGIHRTAPPPLPSSALRAYNLGRYYLHQGTFVSVRHAIVEFQVVVRDAPASALGYADLAQAEVAFTQDTMRDRHAMLARAIDDACTALRIDPRSVTAQTALAVADFYAHEPPSKIDAAYKRAIALDDGNAMTHMYYGQFLLMRNDLRAAYAHFRRATDLDPSLGDANVMVALTAYKLGDPQTAIHYAREGLGFGAPDKFDAYQTLGYAYVAVGQPQSALHAFHQLHDWDRDAGNAGVAYVHSRMKLSGM
ncbi:MAG TPA: winged helix-turn-helix domain-containing protein [Candidatus Acidoferrum sp.]|nr:winged helix-turn-helix domain-containing protein [Candidatus Acidoferrum sp.]